jgi:dolichol-phosphate mannosyltransferase
MKSSQDINMESQKELILSVLMPVRNDETSVAVIVKVLNALVNVSHELLVVTDDPLDTTIPVIEHLSLTYKNLRHISNKEGIGVLNAVKAGVKAAKGKYVLIYAADEMGPVLAIDDMLTLMDSGCDFVSGTRYSKGGKRYGGSIIGHLLSRVANSLFNFVSATALTDCTTGLKIFRRELFEKFELTPGSGWSFAFQMAISAQRMGLRIGEVPIVSIDRLFGGQSTFKLIPWICSYSRGFVMGVFKLPPWYSPKPILLSKLNLR